MIASNVANGLEKGFDLVLEFLRPGIVLVVLGQLSFVTTITSLVITARLKKFDQSMEEAAYNPGASKPRVLRTILLPFLRPALIAAGIVSFLVSFENFNITLFLVGSEAPLTITMYDRKRSIQPMVARTAELVNDSDSQQRSQSCKPDNQEEAINSGMP